MVIFFLLVKQLQGSFGQKEAVCELIYDMKKYWKGISTQKHIHIATLGQLNFSQVILV